MGFFHTAPRKRAALPSLSLVGRLGREAEKDVYLCVVLGQFSVMREARYFESEYGGSRVVGLSREVDFWESQCYG